jgi:hypothetical protein
MPVVHSAIGGYLFSGFSTQGGVASIDRPNSGFTSSILHFIFQAISAPPPLSVESRTRPYRPPDASVVRAGEASDSAMVAQFVPAAEIH